MVDVKVLSSIALFQSLPASELAALAQSAKLQYYKKGTLIFDEDKASHYFIYAIKGWVKLSRSSADGAEVIIDVFNDNHYAGETFLFEENSNAYCVEAISDLELLMIPIAQFKQFILAYHTLALALLQTTLNKQNKLTMEVEHLSIKNAIQRLGCFLLRLCTLQKTKDITLKLPYDKSLLASRLGIRPETFSRALSKMCDEYGIEVTGDVLKFNSIYDLAGHVCQNCSKTFPCKDIMQ
jgi:CRP-like cAMP-binding protein